MLITCRIVVCIVQNRPFCNHSPIGGSVTAKRQEKEAMPNGIAPFAKPYWRETGGLRQTRLVREQSLVVSDSTLRIEACGLLSKVGLHPREQVRP